MNRLLLILFFFCVYSHVYAQTPYDSFSPATSRPILDVVQNLDANKDSLQQTQMDIAIATTDDVSKWLSPDPLSDKYPEISPYAYCGWNPVKYIDPDGRDAVLITFPNYRAMYRGHKIPHTGHSGVLLINNKTGMTKYYEYGRYGSDIGRARNVRVPNVKIKDGRPTNESLSNVLKTISKTSGDNGDINGAYIKSNEFEAMQLYAEGVVSEANNPNRKPYDIFTNNCATFAEDVIAQDESVDKPTIFIHTPINTVEKYQKNGNAKVFYDSKTQETSWNDGTK